VTDGYGGHEPDTGGPADARRVRLPAIGLVALAVLALALAAVLVVSPDEHHRTGGHAPATTPAAPGVDIVTARARAALRPCPAPVSAPPQPPAVRAVDVECLGDGTSDDPVCGLSLLTALGVHFPSVTDADDAVIRALRAPAYLPVTYVATPDGIIRQVLPPTPFTAADQVDRAVRSMTTAPRSDTPARSAPPLR
jgi:hypothetical protein